MAVVVCLSSTVCMCMRVLVPASVSLCVVACINSVGSCDCVSACLHVYAFDYPGNGGLFPFPRMCQARQPDVDIGIVASFCLGNSGDPNTSKCVPTKKL
jgi:hypothetical protein